MGSSKLNLETASLGVIMCSTSAARSDRSIQVVCKSICLCNYIFARVFNINHTNVLQNMSIFLPITLPSETIAEAALHSTLDVAKRRL